MTTVMAARRRRSSHNTSNVIVCCFSVLGWSVESTDRHINSFTVSRHWLGDPVKRFDFSVSEYIESDKRTYSSTSSAKGKKWKQSLILTRAIVLDSIADKRKITEVMVVVYVENIKSRLNISQKAFQRMRELWIVCKLVEYVTGWPPLTWKVYSGGNFI